MALVIGGLAANRPPLLDPPGPWVRLRTYLGSNRAETVPEGVFPELRPRVYALSGPEVYRSAVDAVADLGWDLRSSDPEGLRIEAVVTTRLFRFKDDVVLRIEPSAQTSTVYCSSRSQIGRGDLAANARHILDLYERLEVRLARPHDGQAAAP
jgi:hypothetical protein